MSSGDLFFTVTYSGRVLDSLETIGHRAAAAGRGEEARIALQRMDGWLRANPETLGGTVIDYEELEQTEYVGVVSFSSDTPFTSQRGRSSSIGP